MIPHVTMRQSIRRLPLDFFRQTRPQFCYLAAVRLRGNLWHRLDK
jgi:hypothetical protein